MREFWKLSPAELLAWCDAANDEDDAAFAELVGDLEIGEEVID